MAKYVSKYTGEEIESILDKSTISYTKPSEGIPKSDLSSSIQESLNDISNKVDKVSGKQLSTEDFTTALKNKLNSLSNYDDTTINNAISGIQSQINTLVNGNASTAIESFNEIIAFLNGITDSQSLDNIIASIEQQIAGKMDKVTLAKVATSGSYSDLSNKPTIPSAVTESTVSGWGFTKNTGTYSKPSAGIPKTDLASAVQTSLGKADTALQSYTEKYTGTVTGVKINGTTKSPSNGVVDLGTIITSHQTLKTINGESILGSGDITIEGGNSESVYYLSVSSFVEESGVVTAEEYEKIKKCSTLVLQSFQNGNIVGSQSSTWKVDGIAAGAEGMIWFTSIYGAEDGVKYTAIIFYSNEDGSATWSLSGGDYAYYFKTINGESILGWGDITVTSNSDNKIPEIVEAPMDGELGISFFDPSLNPYYPPMESNKIYIATQEVENAITIGSITPPTELYGRYELNFTTASGEKYADLISLSVPNYIKWEGGLMPTVEIGKNYSLVINASKLGSDYIYTGVLSEFYM